MPPRPMRALAGRRRRRGSATLLDREFGATLRADGIRGDTGELLNSRPKQLRGFRRYQTLVGAVDRTYVASGGQGYGFAF